MMLLLLRLLLLLPLLLLLLLLLFLTEFVVASFGVKIKLTPSNPPQQQPTPTPSHTLSYSSHTPSYTSHTMPSVKGTPILRASFVLQQHKKNET